MKIIDRDKKKEVKFLGGRITEVKQETRNEIESNGVRFHQITENDAEQKQILDLLQVAL